MKTKTFTKKMNALMSKIVFTLTLFAGFTAHAQIINTIAGNHLNGCTGDGGQATSAKIQQPDALAFDTLGNLYIGCARAGNEANSVVREVNTTGVISTVAGMGGPGGGVAAGYSGDGGQATDALMYTPSAIAFDKQGNMYIADQYNNLIRKVDASGVISTFAGNYTTYPYGAYCPNGCGDGGPATAAGFDYPSGLAFDTAGNLYIADNGNNVIRMVNTSGIITTVIGNTNATGYSGDGGMADTAGLAQPLGIAFDANNNLYIADYGNSVIRKVDMASGIISTVAGMADSFGFSGDGGAALAAKLNYPTGVAFDPAGNMYIADNGNTFIDNNNNNVVRMVNAGGIISTVAGNDTEGYTGNGGLATQAELNGPYAIAFDTSGNLYIADQKNNVVREVTQNCSSVTAGIINSSGVNSFCSSGSDTLTLIGETVGIDISCQWLTSTDSVNWTAVGYAPVYYTGTLTATTYYKAVINCGVHVHDTSAVYTITVTPNSVVTPTVDISASATTVFSCTPVIFTATPGNGGTAPVYQWMKNGIDVGTDSAAYIDSTLNSGDKITCMLTSNVSCATTTTVAYSDTVTMTVNPIVPAVNITFSYSYYSNLSDDSVPSPNGGLVPLTICQGSSLTYSAAPVNGGATPSYQWIKNGVPVGTDSSGFTTNDLTDNDTITCIMTSSIGCATPSTATSNAIVLPFTPYVTPTVTISCANCTVSSAGDSICSSQFAQFVATTTNSGTGPAFTWERIHDGVVSSSSFGDSVLSYTASIANALGALTDGDQIVCQLNSSAACVLSPYAMSDTISMIVIPAVTPTVSVSTSNGDTICAGTPETFTATPTNGGDAPFYEWIKNGAYVSSPDPTYTDNGLNDGDQIVCILTSSLSCITLGTISDTETITINASITPTVSISVSPGDTVCAGIPETFTVAETNGGNTPSYQWTKNGTAVSTATSYTDNTPGNNDLIVCRLISSVTCAAPDSVSDSLTVTVHPLPVPVITYSSGNVLSTGTYITYQWSDTAVINGATNSTYTPTHNGSYTVTVTDSNGCSATSTVYNVTGLGIMNVNNSSAIRVYPNPTTGVVYIESSVPVTAELSGVDGKMVLRQENAKTIDISELADGLYLLTVYNKDRNVMKIEKIIKE